ncbi:(Fe-S)-binding protein [uncultured Draconibacterium sp.]|uniref:(Fe-S)-binding protein n=1 Tax=uncultured Draconibacterium sp. TaxID=1573823 RepID=UPI002AA60829|nr:(Fe-S)-binding protein [uncultured Draconibacterium sp.]
MDNIKELEKLLPGYNCGACGCANCAQFALKLNEENVSPGECVVLNQYRFKENMKALKQLVQAKSPVEYMELKGLIDALKADFALLPLHNESSCRETLASFSSVPVNRGNVIRYRPLGCPIIHFAKVIEVHNNLMDVWIIGPGKLQGRDDETIDLGICLILSFQGTIEGTPPKVGQTVKFLPSHCMMGKVHSGVVVHLEDKTVRIDGIDLKVWEHALK